MRIAAYNLENLFMRPVAMNGDTLAEGRQALQDHAALNAVLAKAAYSAADKKKIIQLLESLGLDKADDGGSFAILRQNRGKLVKRPKAGGLEIVADGRGDWIGWVDLEREQVDEVTTRNTARVIKDVNADILGVVEADNRPALLRFTRDVMPTVKGKPYPHAMLIDGNDERGIDVGIYTRKGFDIVSMVSHVDDEDDNGKLFSRDCAHYEIKPPSGAHIHVLVNHFKSKGFGPPAQSSAKRLRQATRVAEIYRELRKASARVVVLGDLNDTPDSEPLKPLFKTDLKDISEHPSFDDGGRPGTYANGTAGNKIDYVLLSPALFSAVKAGGIFRKGVWGGKNGTLFEHYPEITKASEAASDHAAIWAELSI
jgi:endonuclease/exonuclease/phosphatase family metal-dependent hydrolase